MKTVRRDTLTILSELLQHMKEPRRITHLLYSSNLSYSQLTKYLNIVQEMGLAQKQTNPFDCFIITSDGEYFVEMIRKRQVKKIITT